MVGCKSSMSMLTRVEVILRINLKGDFSKTFVLIADWLYDMSSLVRKYCPKMDLIGIGEKRKNCVPTLHMSLILLRTAIILIIYQDLIIYILRLEVLFSNRHSNWKCPTRRLYIYLEVQQTSFKCCSSKLNHKLYILQCTCLAQFQPFIF